MKRSMRWIGLPVAALVAACGGETAQDDFDMVDTPPAATEQPPLAGSDAPMAAGAMAETAEIREIGGSGASGEVSVTDRGGQTEVMVRLANVPPDATLPGHIHTGTCESIGGVVQPLEQIATDGEGTGTMTASVELPAMTVMDGQHIVVYHGDGGTPIACAEIPAHTM